MSAQRETPTCVVPENMESVCQISDWARSTGILASLVAWKLEALFPEICAMSCLLSGKALCAKEWCKLCFWEYGVR